ncbi:MAG TPA: tetratricopeptide repeat protein [Candidatus Eisenbacteria bacterium]|nr:tetratricopeptide repeat protein [Candidatus Eisenbacteria bacterium]
MSIRAARFALLGLCIAYFAAVLLASRSPGPLEWGLHSFGFLPFGARAVLISMFLGAIALTLWGCVAKPSAAKPEEHPSSAGPNDASRFPRLIALLLLFCAGLYVLRARTHLLGDGTVWLTILKTGQHQAYSEPLAAAIWIAFGSIVRSLLPGASALEFGSLSILCGGLSFLICFALAKNLAGERQPRTDTLFLLLTLGITELYCGYLESYPPVMVLILGYLWLGLRSLTGKGVFATAPVLLSLATASHFLALYLWPSYLYLVAQREQRLSRQALWSLVPVMLTPALALLAGSRPSDWLESWRIALHATAPHGAASGSWGFLTFRLGQAADLLNEVLLIVPIAVLLAIAALTVRSTRQWLRSHHATYLAAAMVPGLAAAFLLALPAPAVDWDLLSVLLVPAAVLCVGLGARLLQGGAPMPFRVGVAGFSLCAVLPFLLVNASDDASLRRFKTLIGPGTRIPARGRAYPNSVLAEFYEDRGDYRSALAYAERAYEGEPTNPRYSVKVGSEYFHLGDHAKAARSYEEAIARGWDRASTHHDLGLSYAYSGRASDAVRELRIAVGKADGERPDYRHDLGVAYARAGYPDSARAVWTRVLERWPSYAPTVKALALRGWR